MTSLGGLEVTGAGRHGKFLDLDVSGVHLVVHLARAGWLHWRSGLPAAPPKPGKGPLALRVHLASEEATPPQGFDLTEQGTRKGLAIYVVRSPSEVPGIARLGPDAVLNRRPLRKITPQTITDPSALRAELGRVRAQGWSTVDEELEVGLLSAAAPVRDRASAR